MEKRKPHYGLSMVQSAIRLRGADAFTATALIGAQAMGGLKLLRQSKWFVP